MSADTPVSADPTYAPATLREVGGVPRPAGWRILDVGVDGAAYRLPGGMVAIYSVSRHEGRIWAHLSLSHKSRMPSWPELVSVRDALLGPDTEAYQVAPPRSRYVNLHPRVLHLFACLDARSGVLPPFEGTLGGAATI